LALHTEQISSTISVNSPLLSTIFPKMSTFEDDRDVIFNLKCPSVDLSFAENNMMF
jgi:hypothetical protein